MVKTQIELNSENKKFIEIMQAKYNLKSKEEAINKLLDKHSFGWIGNPYQGLTQTLLEAIIDKIIHYEAWIDYRTNNTENAFWKKVEEIFNLDNKKVEKLKEEYKKRTKNTG